MVQIASNLVQPPTDSPQLMYQGLPCHASLVCLYFTWRVKSECFQFPYYFSDPPKYSSSELGLSAVLKTYICIFWFLTFFSIMEILYFHFPCPLLLPPAELDFPLDLVDFFPPFLFLRALRTFSFSFLLIAYHSFESY